MRSKARLTNGDQLVKDPSALGLPFLELLDYLALHLVLGRTLRGLQAGGGVPLLAGGEFVARLRDCLGPLALLYVTPAVYAHAFLSLSIGQTNENVAT